MNKEIKNLILTPFNLLYHVNPVLETKLLYLLKNKRRLNLNNPITYNEKLQWLKLYYRNDLMPKCADKFSARQYIEERGYGKYLPKLYWHGFSPEDIPFDTLPNEFVIKSTSGSGNNIIVRDKRQLDLASTKRKIRRWMKEKYLVAYGEWHYSKIKPSIIIEELLSDGVHDVPMDFKMFCFNNCPDTVLCTAVDMDRFNGHKRAIYNQEWKFLGDVKMKFNNGGSDCIPKPLHYEKMVEIASDLANPFPHARIDFFVTGGGNFFVGEITFFNGAGYDMVTPDVYNRIMGDCIKLPDKNNRNYDS